MYWEAYSDSEKSITLSTAPEATLDNFARDMQWGQALQLIEDHKAPGALNQPVPVHVKKGDKLDVICCLSSDTVLTQFRIERVE